MYRSLRGLPPGRKPYLLCINRLERYLLLVALLLAQLQWDEDQEEELDIERPYFWLRNLLYAYFVLFYAGYAICAMLHYQDEQLNTRGKEAFLKRKWYDASSYIRKTHTELPYVLNRVQYFTDLEEHWREGSLLDWGHELLDIAEVRQPEDVHVVFMRAKLLRIGWEYEYADSLFGVLEADYPYNALYAFERYKGLRENGTREEACRQLEKAVSLMPRLLELDSICELKQRDSLFYRDLSDRLLSWTPSGQTTADEFARRGCIAYLYDRNEQAASYLRQAVDRLPNLSVPWFLLGQIYKEAGRTAEATDCLKKYRLLTYGAFAVHETALDSMQLPPFHERDLLKPYAMKFADWYKSGLFLPQR